MEQAYLDVRRARGTDASAFRHLAAATGLMTEEEAQGFAADVDSGQDGEALWACACLDGAVVGTAYVAREPFSDDVWNLLFLAVDPAMQGRGTGSSLVHWIEEELGGIATALVVDTSGQDAFAATRSFYVKLGYREVGSIPDYYGAGDSKVTFWRTLL